ncbi:MAG: SPFH domain-containing protein [Oscillospiraceae bacterium]|nr:SPFH domain-containing protein [Oscillospiraceae bacterium]
MGLIKAAIGAGGGVLADQWKEYFYCDSLPANVLAVRGQKRVGGRSSNKKGDDNIITTGSVIAVADGQCMIVVEQGKVLDVCSLPGEFIFDSGGEPSLFAGGDLGANFVNSLKSVWERFKFGGQPGKDTRVFYFNTKELIGNKYGTPNPVPFRVVDTNIGLDIDISIRCFGEYSYKMTNPILFYTNISGNISAAYTRDALDSQLKTELMTALQPAFAKISALGIRYSALPGHTAEIADALNEVLSAKWRDFRGIEIVSFGVSSVNASKEDEDMIKTLQKSAVMRDPGMAAATLVGAQADAMRAAASNESTGPMMAFAGMNMAAGAGGMNAGQLFAMQQQQQQQMQQQQGFAQPPVQQQAQQPVQQAAPGWSCKCGSTGNTGKFCGECASPKPAGIPQYKCDKCGWTPDDPAKPPKFCPECADPFNDGDIK